MPAGNDAVSGDTLLVHNFMVEVGPISGFFTEISGLGSEHEVVEQKLMGPGGVQVVRKLPGRLKWGDLTLKRGITANFDMWTWRKQIEDGDVASARSSGTISLLDQEGTEVASWTFENAWPTKISGPSIKSDTGEIAIEELTLAVEDVRRIK